MEDCRKYFLCRFSFIHHLFGTKIISSTLKIHPNSLYQWIQEYEKYGESAFPGHGSALRHAQFEIKKLEKENKLLQEELALLKKFQVFLKPNRK
ncbi:TPA: transposase [Streptococcus pyogenes]|uniref:transposase n=5 Tax=Streptococcus pyogenes TaxID=1314 RepID=UPI00051357B9|nr:transposase family protein [Streptococcus pyogenes AA216]QCK46995.1 transposase [Streptococcus pyogenes]QCK65526.1 transposase [Streptococcus pyogenes]RXS32230.1 transposase [Streptococcus pyogenes]SQF20942.1 transposase [Streptococcus pyogenes]